MATKKREPRMFLLGGEFVIILNKEVISVVEINEEKLKEEIDEQVRWLHSNGSITKTFMKAVTNLTGIPFSLTKEKVLLGGRIFEFSIHDDVLYKRYEAYILNHEVVIQNSKKQAQARIGRREMLERNREVMGHIKALKEKRFRREVRRTK